MGKLKYSNWTIVLQEVPGEVSIAINITGCPHRCAECHSSYLGEDIGAVLEDNIETIMDQYDGLISCVCLMGGDQCMENLISILKCIKQRQKKPQLKTCVYSGADDISTFTEALPYLDYLKIGHYDKERGALDHKTTNQRFYEIRDNRLVDRTYLFWREYGTENKN